MSCEHRSIDPKVIECAGGTSSNKGIIVDVWCKDCGLSGSLAVEPEDVAWEEPEKEEPDNRIFIAHPDGSFECENCAKTSGSYETIGEASVQTWEEYSEGWLAPCICKACKLVIPVYLGPTLATVQETT